MSLCYCCSGPFEVRAQYATTKRGAKLGQKPKSPEDSVLEPAPKLRLPYVAIARKDARAKLGSDRLMIGVRRQFMLSSLVPFWRC